MTHATKDAFEAALMEATFIKIDGQMFRIIVWDGEDLHFEDENTGETYVNPFEELVDDMDEIELFAIVKSWG